VINKNISNLLPGLVGALPEVYQPIFAHPELSGIVSRDCEDRFLHITQAYRALEGQLNRPLRVLDLGCAQGFFSFNLAKLGAMVDGVDYLDANIEVCRALATEYPEFKVSFQVGRIEDILPLVEQDQYDLVLGLSVFHHLVYKKGINVVKEMLAELSGKITAGIFELALHTEPVYWAPFQPQNSRSILDGFIFVHELAEHKTHLSDVYRPLFVASNQYWFLNGQAGKFDVWQVDSHVFACGVHRGTRRYFFGKNLCIKIFYLDRIERAEINFQEYSNEITFLSNPPPGFNSPRLLQQGKSKNEIWLVREQVPGELLFDIISAGKKYDAQRVLRDILAQLVALEAAGIYHNDMRIWNVIIGPDGRASLIDYGAITKDKKDCVWSSSGIFLTFFIFVYEVTTGQIDFSNPVRTKASSVYQLKQPYQNWLFAFWQTSSAEWSFKLLQQLFIRIDELEKDSQIKEGALQQYWIKAIEESVNAQVSFDSYFKEQQLRREMKNKAFQKTVLSFQLMLCLFKRAISRLFLWPLRKMLTNPYVKIKALNVIDRHPKLKKHLRMVAMRLGLIVNRSTIKEYKKN